MAKLLVKRCSVSVLALSIIACSFFITITLILHNDHQTISSLKAHRDVEKETTLHFYLHDTPGGENPSAMKVVVPSNQSSENTSQTPFGTIWIVDDPLTVSPDPKSAIIGNCRGLYVSAARNEPVLVAHLDFGFTSGEFNGSSVSMFSRNPVVEREREFAVVGGRGAFRMARGFAKLTCLYYNESNGDSIVEYKVVVRHY